MADVLNGGDDEGGSASVLQVVRYLVQMGYLCYGFSFFPTSLVTLTTSTFPSTAQPVHLFLSHLYSFALLSTATRIASLFLFHHSYVFFPSLYVVPLGLCAFSCSINTSSVLM